MGHTQITQIASRGVAAARARAGNLVMAVTVLVGYLAAFLSCVFNGSFPVAFKIQSVSHQ